MVSKFRIAVFISILTVVLLFVDWVIFKALSLAFGAPVIIGWICVALSLGFLLSSIIGMRFYTIFTRALYWVTAVWIGFLPYVFFASIANLTLSLFLSVSQEISAVAVFFIVASGVGVYGVIHGCKLVIKEVSVEISNIPASWKGRRAVWISDTHIGQIYGRKRMEKIVAHISAQSPDIVFIGGDLYDGSSMPDIVDLASPLGTLKPSFGTYFVAGNHEEFDDESPFIAKVRSLGIRVLHNETVNVDGVQIVGVDYRTTSQRTDFHKVLSTIGLDSKKPSILLKHEPKDIDISVGAHISLQISGHVHRGQEWPFEYVAKLTFKGFTYGLRRFGNTQVYISSGTGTWGPPLRVGSTSEIVLFRFI